jgi:uncharacterized membrane protein YedE/YeeE
MQKLISIVAGVVFGIGLILSGMTDPAKVKGFLDIGGHWDPSLALVMAGAIGIGMFAFTLAKRREVSWTGSRIDLPANASIDARLITGGVLFGAGWGVAGYCPGPALVSLGYGSPEALVFVAAMVGGMLLHDRLLAQAPASAVPAPSRA